MKYAAILLMVLPCISYAGELELRLYGNELPGNEVRVALYSARSAAQFPSDDTVYRGVLAKAATDSVTVIVKDIPPGTYAVAAYVDDNKNGHLDKDFIGIPIEDYGFSNDARSMLGEPEFKDSAFEVKDVTVTLSIHLH